MQLSRMKPLGMEKVMKCIKHLLRKGISTGKISREMRRRLSLQMQDAMNQAFNMTLPLILNPLLDSNNNPRMQVGFEEQNHMVWPCCSRIGDFSIAEEFRQQFDQISVLKDFEQINNSRNQSASQDSNLISGGNADRSTGLVTARGNLELIIDSFVKKEDKIKAPGECKVISEDVLADNELQIQNGQIHLEKNKTEKLFPEPERQKYFDKEDIIKDEKIEIEYFNDGKLNKIYVPLNPFNGSAVECALGVEKREEKDPIEGMEEKVTFEGPGERSAPEECEERKVEVSLDNVAGEEDTERPFKPFVTELSLPVWGNGNSSSVGRWEGDMLAQQEEAFRLMEELSSGHVFADCSVDPNRPRACAFAEEDVKKMIREIEEISFSQNYPNCEDFDVSYNPDGQGDADLESKSFIKTVKNSQETNKPEEEPAFAGFISESSSGDVKNAPEPRGDREREATPSGEIIPNQNDRLIPSTCNFAPEVETSTTVESNEIQNDASADTKQSAVSLDWWKISRPATPEEENKPNYILCSTISEGKSTPDDLARTSDGQMLPEGQEAARALCTTASNNALVESKSDVFVVESISVKGLENERNISQECFPEKKLSENTGSVSSSKLLDLAVRNLELVSELDSGAFQGKRSDVIKGSRSVSDAQEIAPELNWQPQQGTISLGRLITSSSETYNRINLDSFSEDKNLELLSMESNLFGLNAEEKRKSKEAGNLLQDSNSWSDRYNFGKLQNDEDSNSIIYRIDEKLEETLNCGGASAENLEKKIKDEGIYFIKPETEEQIPLDCSPVLFSQTESKKSLNLEQDHQNSTGTNREDSSTSSQTQIDSSAFNENGHSESTDTSDPSTQRFKLHSQKMYWGRKYEPGCQATNEFTLTESEEAFIDMTESVIQVIEPPENNLCEDFSKISFSLLSEEPRRKIEPIEVRSQMSLEKCDSSDLENQAKQLHSGMTTIGPIKNSDYDPKDLTAPEIDYGKMTRITSSRTLAKDMSLFSSDVTTVKIIEEDDSSDDNLSLNAEEDRLERTSLVNRDIASLTKVQKVREVMSYQPKPEEDFEDEEALARPRLDLKDVESMTDERYKVPDVSIPLLSFEIGDATLDAEKELMDSMGLVISGLTNPVFFDEDMEEEDYTTIEKNLIALNTEREQVPNETSESSVTAKEISSALKVAEGGIPIINMEVEIGSELPKENNPSSEGDSQHEGFPNLPKYGTLGSVFKKASSRLLRKDSDLYTRNSKSLPRDASKSSATESIRSLLDDCHSSASNVLKKSRSLLKNSQSILKSISQSRVAPEHGAEQKKLSPSESDVTTIERKLSGFLKKEDFAKAKNLIMTKIEKKFKTVDSEAPPSPPSETLSEKRDLRVALRNERNLQVDRLENFKKLAPKSPLVYKSQFVKSQMSFRRGSQESQEVVSSLTSTEEEQKVEEVLEASPAEERNFRISSEDADFQEEEDSNNPFFVKETPQQTTVEEGLMPSVQENLKEEPEPQPELPDFIVMETIPGLPAADLDGLSSGKVVGERSAENKENIENQKEGSDVRVVEATNSLQLVTDGGLGIGPCIPETEEEKMSPKTPSERKIKTKKKKFTARFRSFWCSAFGRVKTPPKKGDLS